MMQKQNWRTSQVYIHALTGKPIRSEYVSNSRKTPFKKCIKKCAVSKDGKEKTSAIIFTNGVVCVGPDVWRLSNRAETTEYLYRTYRNITQVESDYVLYDPPSTLFFDQRKECMQNGLLFR